jgi:hypothetical protein
MGERAAKPLSSKYTSEEVRWQGWSFHRAEERQRTSGMEKSTKFVLILSTHILPSRTEGSFQGLCWGGGPWETLSRDPEAGWRVLRVPEEAVHRLADELVEFRDGEVVYEGHLPEAAARILLGPERWDSLPDTAEQRDAVASSQGRNAVAVARGDGSASAAAGDSSHALTRGHYSKSASAGNSSTSASDGYGSASAAAGQVARSAASGDDCKAASSGNQSFAAASGYGAASASGGNYSRSAASGNYSKSSASGYAAVSTAYGYGAASGSCGDASFSSAEGFGALAASVGYGTKAAALGENGMAVGVGMDCAVKAGANGVIAAAYFDEDSRRPRMLVGYVGVDGIEADVWYRVRDGRWEPAEGEKDLTGAPA